MYVLSVAKHALDGFLRGEQHEKSSSISVDGFHRIASEMIRTTKQK